MNKEIFEEAKTWETEMLVELRRSRRNAWIIAIVSVLLAIGGVFSVAALAPLKTVEPFVIRVDNTTGIVDVVAGLDQAENRNYSEVVDKFFLAKYIRYREAYLLPTLKHDRYAVGLMSSDKVAQAYAEYTDPTRNANAPVRLYGNSASASIEIRYITFLSDDVAVVRFIKRVERTGQRPEKSYWAATIKFHYTNAKMEPKDRLINPLGFIVDEYRLDPEYDGDNQ